MRDDLFLGLDIGTSSVKAVILDAQQNVLAQAEAPNDLSSPHIGWAEQDVSRWIHNVIQTVSTCLKRPDVTSENIQAIGVSGMVPALVLLDRDGNALRPAIQYNDARAVQQIQDYAQRIGEPDFFRQTGASLSVQSIGPKLAWIRQHEPHVWQKTAAIMGSYDAINHFLTGQISAERNWALEGGLFDIQRGDWSVQLCAAFGIPLSLLPQVHSSLEIIGRVQPQAAALTGLRAGTPVIAGSADHVAAAFAAGITTPGDVLIKFGSSGDVLYCSDRLVLDPHFYIDYHCLPDTYLPNGCMATSGSLLKWFVNEFCRQDFQNALTEGQTIYEYLDRQAEKIPPGANGITVLPYFLGAKTPLNNPDARGVFYGMTLSHTRFHLYRAVLESVIYGFRDHFEVFHRLGLTIRRVVASEGGARSRFWRQMAADILNTPIEFRVENHGSAYGAAVMAGMALGILTGETAHSPHAVGAVQNEVLPPDPQANQRYEKSWQIYQQLYRQMVPVFSGAKARP